jgi:hypothetical protein
MKTSATLIIIFTILGASIDGISAGCFSDELWQDKAVARYHVERACRGYNGKQGVSRARLPPESERLPVDL